MHKIIFKVILLTLALDANADCVIGAKSKTNFQIIDSHTILLSGGIGKNIIIKTFSYFTNNSTVTVLKDSFCDYENAVLYVDGDVVDAQQVKSIWEYVFR